ncbi:LysR family transcriptional regulator [Dehalobacter sp. DCM]|uniref:LysR family transcriptional regulator n=1 Tax=Dehalobacter sp. DCM TaxID=2907827 RepID=UPI00308164BE|nr:LysR family transcriptional regulator [Dehalobacter sp. DCM]
MNFHNLKIFIDVAELGSFTKAAQKNYVSQTAVSLQIASMEKELGFPLFIREKNEISLTQAGKAFYDDCSHIVFHYNHAIRHATEVAKGKMKIIRVGVTGPGDSVFLPEIAAEFNQQYPGVQIKLDKDTFYGIKNKLKRNLVDVSFNFAYDLLSETEIMVEKLIESEVVLLVSRYHRFAQLDCINPIEVAHEKIIMVSKDYGPANFEHMMQARRMDGYEPILELVESAETLLMYVEMNQGVAFVPELLFQYNPRHCKTVRLKGSRDTNEYVISWMRSNKNDLIPLFIEKAKTYFQQLGQSADRKEPC